ncbi:endonuclease/exonuclease/phosphatase family protein [Brevundimonas lenta]|uniref:Endonuclease/exonuclease/phosphatase (EEP) superfamily protein YafD n=1 Tax=Brevundimonas lenta TaxID=424796 RepID=A0A7W6JET0_9CAUL|nr:endonuclease/exonuclease/phosphatase family protein [Brevundimonas lenta]MBB4083799.1 endonuclease/exonuclease/phosphatase (EEP) superfamily protein YafD [Brevundimonas lenta]
MTTGVHHESKTARPLARIAFSLVALALVCAPLPIALAALSGNGHRWADILAQFTAPALIASLILAGGFLLIRRWRWAAATGGVIVLLTVAVWPQWFSAPGRAEAGAPVVRMYSANLYYLNNDVAAIRRSIEDADADIVVLIELGREPAGRIDEILEGYTYRVASMRLDQTRGPSRSVIASRYPLDEIPSRPNGLHSVGAVASTPLGRLNVIGVHLTRPWPFQFQWGQITQTMALGDIRRTLTGPVVVAGDFNSVSSARIGRQVKRDMSLSPAGGFPGTWPSALPSPFGVTIDQVWRSDDLAFVSRRLGRPTGSDHRPVVTEFTRAAD